MTSGRARQVVVGVDGSTSALHAVRWAAREAGERGTPLRLVHVHSTFLVGYPVAPVPQDADDALLGQARGWLRQAVEAAAEVAPGLEPEVELISAQSARDVLIEESAHARLVALGSRGLGGFAGMLIGSVALGLASHGHAPVVVVRGKTLSDPPPDTGPVLLGVDGSPASENAIAFAFDQASWRKVGLVALHTWSDVATGTFAEAGVWLDWEAIEAEEQQLLAQRLAGWQDKYPDVPVQRVVTRDRPVRSLLAAGEEAQLIVVGSRGRGAFAGMLLGSTSQALLQHAPCPVAVVRSDGRREDRASAHVPP